MNYGLLFKMLCYIVLSSMLCIAVSDNLRRPEVDAPDIVEYPILTEYRLSLLKDYMNLHYGIDSVSLEKPGMIVVHYTAIPDLANTLAVLQRETLSSYRTEIAGHGDVNVSVHYVIAKDGIIYRLQPENIAARHAIGFNWCALGIEIVAANEKQITPAQLSSCSWLVAWIASRLDTVQYMVGHYECTNWKSGVFSLYRENDPAYSPKEAADPGAGFMARLRATIASKYSISLKY